MTVIPKNQIAQFIGHQPAPTPWLRIDQERVNGFADITLDHQFIHVDPIKAASGPFGGTIAHGFLTLSLLAYFIDQIDLKMEHTVTTINYGCDKLRFLMPVKVGSEIRACCKLMQISEPKPGQFLLKSAYTIEIRGEDKPALATEWLEMHMTEPA